MGDLLEPPLPGGVRKLCPPGPVRIHGQQYSCLWIDLLKGPRRPPGPLRARQDHATANKFTRRIAASVGANIVGALHVAPRHNIQTGGEAQKPEDRGINRGQAGTSAPTLRRTTAHRAIAPRPPHAPARQTEPKVGVARCAGASGTERRRCGLARSRTARLPC